jgi:glycerol-3-phosphate acyltransferase PlsY
MTPVLLLIFSYLLGSVPFGLIIAKAHGKDLRAIGSGNIGATNLARALGKKWAYICFCLDLAKGLIPVLIAAKFIAYPPASKELIFQLAVGLAAVLGHVFPVYVKFKGGKGVATSFGVALGLWPYYTLPSIVVFVVWVIVVLIWRYISLGSIIAAAAFPVIMLIFIACLEYWRIEFLWPLVVVAVILPALVIFLHRKNIQRLLAGTENKVLQKKPPQSQQDTHRSPL